MDEKLKNLAGMIKTRSLLLFLVFIVCGCAKSDAEKAVLSQLKDPDSAQFGKFNQIDGKHACLGINARNSFGGYTGEKQAVLFKTESGWSILGFEKISHDDCIDLIKKLSESDEQKKQEDVRLASEKENIARQFDKDAKRYHETMLVRYVTTSPNVVTDTNTGLVWPKNSNIAVNKMKWKEAMMWAKNLKYDGKTGWRLPKKEEWEKFADGIRWEYLEGSVFKGAFNDCFWSSDDWEGTNKSAYEMYAGKMRINTKTGSCYVWPVRTGP